MLDQLFQDVRYGLRRLRGSPTYTITAVLILGLGIGANAVVFSLLDALVFSPLPYPDSRQLVALFTKSARDQRDSVSYPDIQDWKRSATSFTGISAWIAQSVNLTGEDEPTRVIGVMAESNFLQLIGIQPAVGRDFRTGEDQPGAPAAVILSDTFWRNRYGGDPAMIGRTLILNGIPHTVIGLLPAKFHLPWADADVLLPITSYPNYSRDRGVRSMVAIGRMKPGVPIEQARTEMGTIAHRLAQEFPASNKNRDSGVERLQEMMSEQVRQALTLLMAAVVFVLLLIAANIANLTLTKALGRTREIAIRASLGARRSQVVLQVLIEGLLLSAAGCAVGLGLAAALVKTATTVFAPDLPPDVQIHLSVGVISFTIFLAVVVGLLASLVPALRVGRGQWSDSLRQRDAGSTMRGNNRTRQVLVAAQIGAAMVLLTGTALLLESFMKLQGVHPGYRPEGLLTMEYRLPKSKYPKNELLTQTHLRIVEAVRNVPGVRGAGSIRALPFSGNGNIVSFSPADKPEPPAADQPRARYNATDHDCFRVMEIPLLRGRVFTADDREDSNRVVVINNAMVRRFWPDSDPIGRQIRLPSRDFGTRVTTATIVGVVGNTKHDGLDDAEMPQIYVPLTQDPFVFSTLIVRTDGNPMAMARAVQRAVWSVDKDQPVWKIRTLDSMIDRSLQGRKMIASVLGGFAGAAMLLAAIGLYGVMAYSVTQRRTEMGVRMALGATPTSLMQLVLREGVAVAIGGAVFGACLAAVSSRFVSSYLFGVTAGDPATYVAIAGVMLITAIVASAIPAWRATRIDPAQALRSE